MMTCSYGLRAAAVRPRYQPVNLALALENYGADGDFETARDQTHVEAERAGDSTANFIA